MSDSLLTPQQITVLGQALLSEAFMLPIPTIRSVVAAAGIDASQIPARSSRAEIVPVIQQLFGGLSLEQKIRALPILAERIIAKQATAASMGIIRLIGQHGFQYRNGNFLPVGLLDEREAQYQPTQAYAEISAAFDRLVQGDESGAITKACAAVESLVQAIYEKNGWTDVPESFQAKVNTVFKRLGVFDEMRAEFTQLEIKQIDTEKIIYEVQEATKHAAEALQVIRRAMGDVHGTKRALRRTVYDSIKWASAICGLLEGQL